MDHPDLMALHEETLASTQGFNDRDVAAWMDPFHEDAITFNGGFVPLSAIRPIAGDLINSYKRFDIDNVDGRLVDDTAVLFGDYVTERADGTVERGAFTFTCVRTGGAWQTLCTHYTPTG